MIPALSPVGGPTTPPFSPDDISGLVAWMDASDSSTVHFTGGKVSSWDSKVGSWSASQGIASQQPTRSNGALNGLDVLTSTGSANEAIGAAGVGLLRSVSGWSAFIVCRTSQNTALQIAAQVSTDVTAARALVALTRVTSGYWGNGGRRNNADAFGVNDSTTQAATSTWKYLSSIASFTSTTITLYLNGSQIAQNTSWLSSGSTPNDGGNFVAFNSSAETAPWFGDIAEILIYNSALGTTDQQSVEAYLSNKWGL